MHKNDCYAFMERFTAEKCEKLYYCLPDIDFPKGLRLIRNELDYSTFISIAYECGVVLPLYVDYFGTTNMQEWLDEEREEVVDTNYEEVVDDVHNDSETNETWHTDDNDNPHFFKKYNKPNYEMSDSVGESEVVNDDIGENEDDEDDVDIDLPNSFNEEQPWKEQQPVLENKENWKWFIDNLTEHLNLQHQGFRVVLISDQHKGVRQTQESVNMERGGEDVAMAGFDGEDAVMADVGG
ncbi:unnamed protein product [Lactuca saligna]|uniref:Uncharacterized protein n=1 Tax=Lactuca saligna TaxID=75948 RepID=A0AA35YV31_LACSI|nr:unnamed protein product [Lactuca saligna]